MTFKVWLLKEIHDSTRLNKDGTVKQWAVRMTTKHTGSAEIAWFNSEPEAAAYAAGERQMFKGCGMWFDVGKSFDSIQTTKF